MQTIKELSEEFASEFVNNDCKNISIKSFTEGVKAAEEWFDVEYNENGCLSAKSYEEMVDELPIIVEYYETEVSMSIMCCLTTYMRLLNDGKQLHHLLSDYKIFRFRPLNRK